MLYRMASHGAINTGAGTPASSGGLSDVVFQAVSDPTRRVVLELLLQGERAVKDLLSHLHGVSQPRLSQHLKVLREAGLVAAEKAGRRRVYRLEAAPLREVAHWVEHFDAFWDEKLDALGAHLARTHETENAPGDHGKRSKGEEA